MQKPEFKLKSPGIAACAVLALSSIGFTGAALAATDTAGAAGSKVTATTAEVSERAGHKKMHRRGDFKRGHHHHRHHPRMGKAALLVPGYGPIPQDVVDSLSLTDAQTALIEDAKTFFQDHRKAQHEKFKEKRQAERTVPTTLDPHAALKRQDARFSAMQEFRAEGSQKWLAVWDSLDDGQQQTLTDYVVKRGEERTKRKAEYREKREARRAQKS